MTFPRVDPILALRESLGGALLPGEYTPQYSYGTAPDTAPPAFVVRVTLANGAWYHGRAWGEESLRPSLVRDRADAHVFKRGEPCAAWSYETGEQYAECEILPLTSEE